MKFATLENGRLAAAFDDGYIDIDAAARHLGHRAPAATLTALIPLGDAVAAEAWSQAEKARRKGMKALPRDGTRLLAPIPEPRRNIVCLGLNYRAHAAEVSGRLDKSQGAPAKPVFFTKATTAISSHGATIPAHAGVTSKLDYEAEVAIIIGKRCLNVRREEAWGHVFGYTAMNDVSARDLQTGHIQWFRGKSLDGFAPMGPVVVHRSVMPALEEIGVRCFVNGELRQSATFDELIFDVPTIIETLSNGMTLLAGDIIATGTPGGVGMAITPPGLLKPGDEVTVEIDGVGKLINRVA